jgi:hypothetical protein
MQGTKTSALAVLLFFIAAAFLVIGFLPSFVPGTGAFDRVESAVCKIAGAALMLGLTWLFVRRDPAARAMLAVGLTGRNLVVLLGSTLLAALIILSWLLVLRLLVPFHLEAGTMTAAGFAFSVVVYLFGSIIEELAFRGVPFLRLRRANGVPIAVAVVSLAFGLFHVPGLQGAALAKVIAITVLSSLVFCLGYLRTGTLWAAIGLHFGLNLTLHSLFGAGDPNRASLLRLSVESTPPGWDAWFWSLTATLVAAAALLAMGRRSETPLP